MIIFKVKERQQFLEKIFQQEANLQWKIGAYTCICQEKHKLAVIPPTLTECSRIYKTLSPSQVVYKTQQPPGAPS